jgi:peroxiredoxin
VRIFGISQNDAADTREFNQEFGVTFPTLLDSEDNGISGQQRLWNFERSHHVPGGTRRPDSM